MASHYPFDPNAAATPGSGVFGLITGAEESAVILIGVPFDATTSYRRGTAGGPAAILEASRQVDVIDGCSGRPYEAGVHMLPLDPAIEALNQAARASADPVIEASGVFPDRPDLLAFAAETNAACEQMNQIVYAAASAWMDRGRLVGVVGGDHSTPFGAIQAASERHPGLGVLHIDAHADLRDAYEGFTWSHASIMHNVMRRLDGVARLVQVGIRDFCEAELDLIRADPGRITTFFDLWLSAQRHQGVPFATIARRIADSLPQKVYVSFDIDGLDPALCPNTGTPVPGGLSFQDASAILEAVVASGREIVGFDLNEVAPGEDGGEWDANVGARMLYRMLGLGLRSRGFGAPLDLNP